MEAVRPQVDAYVLDWITRQPLSREWFFEQRDGTCRLMGPFAVRLSETAPTWARAVAPLAEWIARSAVSSATLLLFLMGTGGMPNEIISYLEMCRRENASLQRGMNFGLARNRSVILMSVGPGAPYGDRLEEDGSVLVYEGHDVPRNHANRDPKQVDQPELTPAGTPTQNSLFLRAAEDYKSGGRPPERVRVYEKLRQGIWSYNGMFHLVDAWKEPDGQRNVFRFKLIAVEGEEDLSVPPPRDVQRRRLIPTAVKIEVWKRDGGRCVICGATDELHFDHDLPYSKGGSSFVAENVQLLCARHNLQKHDRIV